MSRAWAWVGAAVAAVVCVQTLAWESQLFPKNVSTGKYETAAVSFGGRSWRLLDYSYAGYRLGVDPLATAIPCTSITLAGTGDIANELQQAVNTIGAGGGGTVIIPAGHYTLSHSIGVPYDNVSIVGAGSGLTFLGIPAAYAPSSDIDEGVFTLGKAIGGWNKGWLDRGNTLATVSGIVSEGDNFVDVQDASAVAVGAWVSIQQYFWSALSQRNSGGVWTAYAGFPDSATADREASFSYLR